MEFRSTLKEILEWVYCIAIAIVLALLFRYFIGTPTVVMHESMYPTLQERERLWINRWAIITKQELDYGDIITFEEPIYDITNIDNETKDANYPLAYYEELSGFKKFMHDFLDIGKTSYIKRVIGKPGDLIEIKDNKVYRNGTLLKEEYLQSGVVTKEQNQIYSSVTVPENSYFVMGDNRSNSVDSRTFGCIPYERVESIVVSRIWPLSKFGKVE